MRYIQPLSVAGFSLLFYVIGVFALAPLDIVVNVVIFSVLLVLAFGVRVSRINSRVLNLVAYTPAAELRLSLWALIVVIFVFFITLYSVASVPIFSDDVEVSRMVLVNNFGTFYRVGTQAVFFLPAVAVAAHRRNGISKVSYYAILLIGMLLVFSMGFRSRVVDYMAIFLISTLIANKGYEGRFFARRALQFALISVLLLLTACLGVVYLTYLRHGGKSLSDALDSVLYRVFYLNYVVNFDRVFDYVNDNGLFYGRTFFTDMLSVITPYYESMQVMVTRYFNHANSDLFIMTPTAYGEFYLNFGYMAWAAVVPLVMAYRFGFEKLLLRFAAIRHSGGLAFAAVVNFMYYVPRQVATGGLSNAFLIRGSSIVIVLAGLCVGCWLLYEAGHGDARSYKHRYQ